MKRFLPVFFTAFIFILVVFAISGCGKLKKDAATDNSVSDETATETTTYSEEMLAMIKQLPEDTPILGTWEFEKSADYAYTFNIDSTGVYHCLNNDRMFTYELSDGIISILYENNKEKLNIKYHFDEKNNLVIVDTFGDESTFVATDRF